MSEPKVKTPRKPYYPPRPGPRVVDVEGTIRAELAALGATATEEEIKSAADILEAIFFIDQYKARKGQNQKLAS